MNYTCMQVKPARETTCIKQQKTVLRDQHFGSLCSALNINRNCIKRPTTKKPVLCSLP